MKFRDTPHLELVSPETLATSPHQPVPWIWDGFVSRGLTTLLTSRWKMGKTTLISHLLSRLGSGLPLAGSAVTPTATVVITEEPMLFWQQRHLKLNFGENVRFCHRPFYKRPTTEIWTRMLNELAGCGADLIIIDPLAMLLPGAFENNPITLLKTLEQFRTINMGGTGVVLIHHARNGGPRDEVIPRGSGSLPGFADILIDLDRPLQPEFSDRVRRLTVTSRAGECFRRFVELTPDGRDYAVLPEPVPRDGFASGWPILQSVLEEHATPPTRREILAHWPEDYDVPSKVTLVRWLEEAERCDRVVKTGCGKREEPFRYGVKREDAVQR